MPAVQPIGVNAETLARHCREEAEVCLDASERFLAGARAMQGVNASVVNEKAQDAMYERGKADAYVTIALALEKLIAQPPGVAV